MLGGERSMLAMLPAISAAGFDVEIAAPPVGPLADAIRASGIALNPWQIHDDRGARLPIKSLRENLAQLFDRQRPHLVHANSLSMARISGPVVEAKQPTGIGHLRDILKLSRKAVAQLNCHRRLVVVSQATRDYHVAQGLAAERCTVVHNGVDLDAFQPRSASGYIHRELGLPHSTRLVATIGQLGLRKGVDVALAAAVKVFTERPNVAWLIVGERTSEKDETVEFEHGLRDSAAAAPLTGRVFFLGVRDDVPKIMNECALLVHAARQEPLGRVLLEAAASGLPVVATDVGGTHEIFPADTDGAVLVPANEPRALANAIVDILGNETRHAAMAAAARRRAELAFNVRDAAARLIDVYHSLL